MKKQRVLFCVIALTILALTPKSAQAQQGSQDVQTYNQGYLNMLSLGGAHSTNLWSSSYIGFNLRKTGYWTSDWATATDGGNNGASAVVGGIAGSLMFLTFPTKNPASGQTFSDASMPSFINMVLNHKGQLKIGQKEATGIHADYRLSVDGKLTARSIYVLADNPTNWADYVFADHYQLTPLPALEKYIKQNKHLPEIPTTSEVAKNGINVGEMNVLLLKKVEELTLHLIEMDKRVKQLESKNSALPVNATQK